MEPIADLTEPETSSSDLQSPADKPSLATLKIADPLLAAVEQRSKATRTALIPRILQPIPRTSLRDRYLSAIQRGTQAGLQRAIAIVGPAGYGKSTILGALYDALLDTETPWVAIALCALLPLDPHRSPSTEDLARALGEAVSGQPRSILEIAQTLKLYGRGPRDAQRDCHCKARNGSLKESWQNWVVENDIVRLWVEANDDVRNNQHYCSRN